MIAAPYVVLCKRPGLDLRLSTSSWLNMPIIAERRERSLHGQTRLEAVQVMQPSQRGHLPIPVSPVGTSRNKN